MNAPAREQVLNLYKQLVRYGKQLNLTDKNYYLKRIRTEFRKNQFLEKAEEIDFNFKVLLICHI